MKIIRLSAENIKRLKAVEITPDGTLQVITGRNAQGKTSVLDAIWLALGGGAASRETARPIRDGQTSASVTLDLGDLVVTRTWVGEKTSLVVKSADGAKFTGPQGVLDDLVGRLSFDPLEFTRLSAREQVAALLDLVDLDVDLDALARERQTAYDQRTEIGRQGAALDGQLTGLGKSEDAPDAEVSITDLVAQLRAAEATHREHQEVLQRFTDLAGKVERLRAELAQAEADLTDAHGRAEGLGAAPDLAAINAQIDGAEAVNAAVRRNTERADVARRLGLAKSAYTAATATIAKIDQTKANALAAATFPVEGLGFDDAGVTYQGVPFAQASASEQIRVSLAMAMALNPRLRVIRILDGSLLDEDNLRLIADMAAGQDYQVWLEKVGDQSSVGVVIEDGSVASVNGEEASARSAAGYLSARGATP